MIDLTGFVVHSWMCDHFGHLNVRHYAAAFDDAALSFWARMGHRHMPGLAMPVTAESKIMFHREVPLAPSCASSPR